MGLFGKLFGRKCPRSIVTQCLVKSHFNKRHRQTYWRWEGLDDAGESVCTDSPPFCDTAEEAHRIAKSVFPEAHISVRPERPQARD